MRLKKMKYIFLSFLVVNSVVGMDHNDKKYHSDGFHYAQVGEKSIFKGSYITKDMYPLFIRRKNSDDVIQARFNFEHPITSIEWSEAKKYALCVTLSDNKTHKFNLGYLDDNKKKWIILK